VHAAHMTTIYSQVARFFYNFLRHEVYDNRLEESLTRQNSCPRNRKSIGIKTYILHDFDILLYSVNGI